MSGHQRTASDAPVLVTGTDHLPLLKKNKTKQNKKTVKGEGGEREGTRHLAIVKKIILTIK